MASYVALLRGIFPTNPSMSNQRLRAVAEELGFEEVRTVISSGNVLFEGAPREQAEIEAELEAAWRERLGFESTTIVRSREQLERLVEADPFPGLEHGPASYLLVTFTKEPPQLPWELPYRPPGQAFRLVAMVEGTLFSVSDTTAAAAPDPMGWLDRTFGRQISSRTWKTVERILARMR